MKGIALHQIRLRAALDGRLSVMRVPFPKYGVVFIEPADPKDWNAGRAHPNMRRFEDWPETNRKSQALFWTGTGSVVSLPAPYAHGETRFVREAWRETWSSGSDVHGYEVGIEYRTRRLGDQMSTSFKVPEMRFGYKLTKNGRAAWRSAVHMPEKYARLTITMLNPRPERAQDVTEEEAILEGIERLEADVGTIYIGDGVASHWSKDHKDAFSDFWNTIYPRYPWAENPWVWRYDTEIGRVG